MSHALGISDPSEGGRSVSRRRALGWLAAGAAPLIAPSRVLGADAPSKRVAIAMIGTGRQAYHTNLPTLLGLPGTRVVSVCDVDRKRAEAAKAKVDAHYGDNACRLFTDFREALEMPGLDGRPGWMRILDYCEGIVTNWGTHLIDVAQLINGTERSGPVSVEGKGTYPMEGSLWNTLTEFQLKYRYANGVTLDYRMDVPYLRVEGDEGWIQSHWNSAGGMKASDPKILRIKFKPSDVRVPTRGDKQDFISAIREGTKVMADAEIGHRTCSIGQIGHIAIRLGRALEWDPASERFKDAGDANAMLQGKYRGPWKI
ncbi:MAG: hypothetical protein J0M04_18175 [Verrucomicrobia bacterium]|nr:hypothetical protein [Verrucomicrobiota bacterium]